jgi:hypothetical protein
MGSRIELTDTFIDVVIKMSEGNPGAVRAIAEIAKASSEIDTDSAWGGLGPMIGMDSMGIYGSGIWMLFKDANDCDAIKAVTTLRCHQMGIITASQIRAAMDRRTPLDHEANLAALRAQLPNFASGVLA